MATLNQNQERNRPQSDDFGCSSAQIHLHAYVEGELDPIRSGLLKEHMEDCSACRNQAEELKLERAWLLEACVDSPALPESFTKKVMLRVKEEKSAQTRQARRSMYLRLGGLGAAAAVVMVSVLTFMKDPRDVNPGKKLRSPEVATVAEVPTRHCGLLFCICLCRSSLWQVRRWQHSKTHL